MTSRSLAGGAAVLALPLLGFGVLLGQPQWDLRWEHHPAHFWLVLAAAAGSAVLAYSTGVAAVRRGDARVLLVSLTFLSTSGFLGLHALATPGVLLATTNAGFALATPVGLAVGSVLAAASSADLSGERAGRAVRRGRRLRAGLLLAMALWAGASLLELPPLRSAAAPERASGLLVLLAVPSIALYAASALRYLRLWRERPSTMVLAMASAFVLLAEAMVAVVFARNWHATWWEWHLLLLAAFALVVWSAHRQWHEERFADLYLDETVTGTREMSVLFADLQGFTRFSEAHAPHEVTGMLNTYFQVVIPPVVGEHGGDIDRIIGDAVMVTFNRRGDQPDHARRAAAAGLALQAEAGRVADAHPGWPRFRVGVNTGTVALSLLGAQGGRTHTVIGDTVNVASRLEGRAPPGGVAIGSATASRIPDARTQPLGRLELKGKTETLEAYLLVSLPETSQPETSQPETSQPETSQPESPWRPDPQE